MPAPPVQVGDLVEIEIERLSQGGAGVGRYQGFVVFVPFTAPQERVQVRIEEVKKSFSRGAVTRILSPGPVRVAAPCPVYGICGGCNWQHVSYPEQLRQKQMMVQKIAKPFPGAKVEPIISSPYPWHYRNRIQLHVNREQVGFLKRGSHEIVNIDECPITAEEVSMRIPTLKGREPGKYEIGLNENHEFYEINVSKNSYEFRQVNEAQNKNMIRQVIEKARTIEAEMIYDLYCGSGNFTIPLAEALPKARVVGVEENSTSIRSAKNRARQLSNIEFVLSDATAYLRRNPPGPSSLMIVDPPRAGLSPELVKTLRRFRPVCLIYVSCHPATASRDWMSLAPDLKVESIQPLDMFPQTDHIELIAVLR